jgi:Ca2+-binding RTX toxin-like protein
MNRPIGVLIGSLSVLIVASLTSAMAASVAVPTTYLSSTLIPVTGNQLRPAQCPALYGDSDTSQVRIASPNFDGSGTSTPLLILGTSVANTIDGGNAADCIVAGGGNDIVDGRQGNDVIIGGPGANDVVRGSAGTDTCFADSFNAPNTCESQNPDFP